MSKKSSIAVSNKKAHNVKFHKTIWDEINEKAKELNVSISQLLEIIIRKHKGNILSIKTSTLVPGDERHNITLSQNAWDKINEIKESEKQYDLTNGDVIESLFAIYKFKLSPQYLLEDEESSKDIDEKIKKNNEVINTNLKSKFGKTLKKINLKDVKNKTLYKPFHAYKFLPLLCDFYKTSHDRQYNKNVNKIYASFIPRMTRFKSIDHVVVFGLQGFIIEHLIKDFRDHFFNLSKEEFDHLMNAFEKQILNSTNDKPYINTQKFRELYELGYLPITINALPEGSIVPMKTPVFEVISEGKFNWVGNFLETYMSTELWYPMTVATIALEYRKLVHEFLLKTSDFNPKKDNSLYRMNISEFGSRGNTSFESGVIASAAWSTCGNKSSNVAVESYLKEFYNLNESIYGMISTEHSVMCSNAAIDGNEKDFIEKLLTELYPTGNLSIVMDSYDYFNVLNKIIPMYKDIITQRDGTLYCRPDCYDDQTQILTDDGWKYFKDLDINKNKVYQVNEDGSGEFVTALRYINEPYQGEMYNFTSVRGGRQLLVTPNHNMVLISKEGKYVLEQAKDLDIIKSIIINKKMMATSSKKKGSIDMLSDIDRLKIAYQADGRTRDTKIYEDGEKSVENKIKNYFKIEFTLSKQRKIDRLLNIVKRLNLKYTITTPESSKKSTRNSKWNDQTTIYVQVDELFSKNLSSWVDLSDKSYKWCREFIEECINWDGKVPSSHDHRNIRFYFSTDYDNAVLVQTIASLAGYHTNFTMYIDRRKEIFKNYFTVAIDISREGEYIALFRPSVREGYNGYIYCVTVPSGRIMVKRGDQVFVSGNSGDPVDNTIKSVQILWRIFGGTTNSKGYKVLDPHIRVMYGDSITIQRARKIFSILERLKFDITNVSLGAGSFSMLCLEEDGMLKPFTRDSFGFALKTTLVTYIAEDGKEKNVYVFKDPKSDTDHFKKSYRGRILVTKNAKGEYKVSDKHGYQENFSKCELKPVFKNGQILNFTTLNEIRERLTKYVNKTVKIKNYKGNKSK